AAAGVGYLTYSSTLKVDPMRSPAGRSSRVEADAEPHVGDQPRPAAERERTAPGRMIVAGRVLDPAGKPVAGVPVDIIGRPRGGRAGSDERMDPHLILGRGTTDADGRFHLEASRTSS